MDSKPNILPSGTLLRGNKRTYRVVQVLGSGGFGITYLVEGQELQNGTLISFYYCMKEHFVSRCCERGGGNGTEVHYSAPVREEVENSLKDFIAEANRLSLIGSKHPNIVKVSDIFEANNTAYYVMEFLQGENLRQYVKSKGRLDDAEAREIMTQVLDAIGYLHANKMTHLDIKPDNVMMVRDAPGKMPRPVLIDFGLSKHYTNDGTPTSTVNTMACSDGYSPIEQYGGITTFSPQSDIYAAGATYLYCLTGRDPRKSTEMTGATMQASLSGLPAQTASVISQMMRPSKDERPQTIREVFEMLNRPAPPAFPDSGSATTVIVPPGATSGVPGGLPPVPPGSVPGGLPPTEPKPMTPYGFRTPPKPHMQKKSNLPLILAILCGVIVLGIILWAALSGGGNDVNDNMPDRGQVAGPFAYNRGTDISEYYTVYVDESNNPSKQRQADRLAPYGPLSFTLLWNGDKDMDLYVNTPGEEDISWLNTEADGGFHSGDNYGGNGSDNFESVRFPYPSSGRYDVFARIMEPAPAQEVWLVVNNNGTQSTYSASLIEPAGADGYTYYKLVFYDYGSGYAPEEAAPADEDMTETEPIAGEYADSVAVPVAEQPQPVRNSEPDRSYDQPSSEWGTFVSAASSSTTSYSHGSAISRYYNADVRRGDDSYAQTKADSYDGSAPLKFTLLWNDDKDLDLYVNDPSGNDVHWNNRSAGVGRHSGDDMGQASGSHESVLYSNPPSGRYDLFISSISGSDHPIDAKVVVKDGNHRYTYRVKVPRSSSSSRVFYKVDFVTPAVGGTNSTPSPEDGSGWDRVSSASSSTRSYSYGEAVRNYYPADVLKGRDSSAESRANNVDGSGTLKVSLLWDASPDLDLYINDASQGDIHWNNRSHDGGQHKGDSYGGSGSHESVVWQSPRSGVYDIFVSTLSDFSSPVDAKVVVKNGSSYTTYKVRIPAGNGSRRFYKVDTIRRD